jgi:membrane-associated protein
MLDALHWLRHLAEPDTIRQLVNFGGPIWVSYLILMAIVFSETGLLVGFFLPGDSLLFTAGFLSSPASHNVFDIGLLIVSLSVAAIVGDAVNYYLGLQMESHVFEKGRLRFVKHEHLLAAKAFYERHGGKAIVLARFAPFVRTFTPFVAGVARMGYRRFAIYNGVGGVGWVTLMSLLGYWLGNVEWVKDNFEKVALLIVAISLLPIAVSMFRAWRGHKVELKPATPPDA